jgi:Surface-adhesin protein E
VFYVDFDTMRRKGDLVKMWQLFDFKTVQTKSNHSFLSSRMQSEYDCVEERTRLLALTSFSGNMGKGNIVGNITGEQKWRPVAPGSVDKALWEVACGEQ